ncbi:MAG: hypothetical protein HQK79_05080 [Desulfobacterales bacterium]|nr:hypothetical protein [Desulfobacterales bacterium]
MKKSIIFLLFFIIPFTLIQSEGKSMSDDNFNYESLWQEVNDSIKKGLPKSTLSLLEKIYSNAKKNKNTSESIKGLIYKCYYLQQVEEDTLVKIQKELNDELKSSEFPMNAVLNSMMAEIYWNYYLNNRWKFLDRTNAANFNIDDMRTWDLKKIVEKVMEHYDKSIENKDGLKNIKIDILNKILHKGNSEKLRPTLYDFLIHRAIDFFINSESSLTKPIYQFTLNNEDFLSISDKFISLKIDNNKDRLSFEYKAITLLQEVLKFHSKDENLETLVDTDLKRLEYVYNVAVLSNKDVVYENVLKSMAEKYKGNSVESEILFKIAKLYHQQGLKYKPKFSEHLKWKIKDAYQICKSIIEKYPNSYGAGLGKELLDEIETKNINFSLERAVIPNKDFLGLLNYKNIDKIYLKIVQTDREELREKRNSYYDDMINFFLDKSSLKSWELKLPDDRDFQSHSLEFKLDKLEPGEYVIFISNDQNFNKKKKAVAYNFFTVTNISYIQRNNSEKGLEFIVVERESGKPIDKTKIQTWREHYSKLTHRYNLKKGELFFTDLQGYANIAKGVEGNNSNFWVEFIKDNDSFMTDNSYALYRNYPQNERIATFFFIDRGIYRPGQTLYFKGIMLNLNSKDGEKTKILPRYSSNIVLYDVNSQKVSELNLTTNEYGTFSGSFIIPKGLLNGDFTISDSYGSCAFSVEEYKRPKFYVSFKAQEESYKLNDKIKITGEAKAYAGFNIDNAQVKYRVIRNTFYPYLWKFDSFIPFIGASPDMEIANGVSKTNDKGEFEVEFQAAADSTVDPQFQPAFNFVIYADVTDLNGETRSSQKTITIGYTALILNISFDEDIDKDNKDYPFTINPTNLSHEPVKAAGEINIFKLKPASDKIFRKRLWSYFPDKHLMNKKEFGEIFHYDSYENEDDYRTWEREEKVFSEKFDSQKSLSYKFQNMENLVSGKYVAEISAKDKFGISVKELKYFTLYSKNDNKPPFPSIDWFCLTKNNLEPGDRAVILAASSEKDVNLICETEYRGEIIERRIVILNNEQKKIEIPIEEKHRGNLNLNFIFVKHNRIFNHPINIFVPWSNKDLKINFETFRSKLNPGEKEEWKIKILAKENKKIEAEMLAAMYDSSLDAFRPNFFSFNPFSIHMLKNNWNYYQVFEIKNSQLVGILRDNYVAQHKIYDSLNWFDFYLTDQSHRRYKSFGGMAKGDVMKSAAMEMDVAVPAPAMQSAKDGESVNKPVAEAVVGDYLEKRKEKQDNVMIGEDKKKSDFSDVKARSNFSETAFFYPNLLTNENGELIISFTVPEALTKWNILGFSHTKNLEYGIVQKELITQKTLMIQPNTPRFLRENDKLIFTAKITNLSDSKIDGDAKLELFDAETMKNIDDKFKNIDSVKKFTSNKGLSALVSWDMEIPEGVDAISYRLVAKSGNFSDGEEQILPVLKNRILVTETIPIPVRANQLKEFKFERLKKISNESTLKPHKLTLEFSSNPAWYAVTALPYMMEYPHECIEQIFSRFYANSIAQYIVNSNPKIKKVFDIWKNKPNKNALLSNLEKNQELKTILLEETPWVMDAKNETERKSRIGLLFDLNRMTDELSLALKKIMEEQLPSGGWGWFKGMRENRYITQHIVTGFAHLDRLKAKDLRKDVNIMSTLKNAVSYLDRRIKEDYDWLIHNKINLDLNNTNPEQIHYLYARSYFTDISVDENCLKAFEYYKGQIKKYWTKYNIYLKGMIALSLQRYGDTLTPKSICKSIKEYALFSEEMGMYWKESYGYNWHQATIETHALIVEVFDEVEKDAESIDELKTWLLKSKQTQDWKTTKATADACYALLLRGDDWIKETNLPDITIGNLKLDLKTLDTNIEAGTGYFKTSWNGKEITSDMGNITVKNNNKVVAWGGVYFQYFENLDKITPAETPLKLNKKLFIEKPSDTGNIIIPIEKEKIKIGDRIKVRIELRVDRDMEFIFMKDMRASAFEPENVISSCKWQDSLSYYESTKDISTNFFFDYLPKGTYVFEYPLRATHEGDFSNGITSIQCMYAPEFSSHSEGIRVKIFK